MNKLMKSCLKVMDEISTTSAYPFQGKIEGQSLNVQSLSRAVTKLYGRHTDKFDAPFTLRDLRRTCKTLMGKAGLDKQLRDRIQGHAFNDVSAKHYDRYDYFKERSADSIAGLFGWRRTLSVKTLKAAQAASCGFHVVGHFCQRAISEALQPTRPGVMGTGFGKRLALISRHRVDRARLVSSSTSASRRTCQITVHSEALGMPCRRSCWRIRCAAVSELTVFSSLHATMSFQ